MIRRFAIALLVFFVATPLFAGSFDQVRRAIEKDSSLDRQWIPFMGVARMFVRAAEPDGIHDIQLAVYETGRDTEWAKMERAFVAAAGNEYQPFVTTKERNGDGTKILAKPRGKLLELLILAHDNEETVLVRIVADPERAKDIDVDHDF